MSMAALFKIGKSSAQYAQTTHLRLERKKGEKEN
jgi:hypothetical protein